MAVDTSPFTHDGVPTARLFEDLATAAANSLAETVDGIPQVTGFFHDQPAEDCCNGVQLWIREWVPVTVSSFPSPASVTEVCQPVDFAARLVLSLRRPCAPVPDDNGRVDPADESELALRLAVDFRALVCGVARDWPGIIGGVWPQARVFYGNAVAQGRNTGCHGWDWDVLIESCGCRAGCGQ